MRRETYDRHCSPEIQQRGGGHFHALHIPTEDAVIGAVSSKLAMNPPEQGSVRTRCGMQGRSARGRTSVPVLGSCRRKRNIIWRPVEGRSGAAGTPGAGLEQTAGLFPALSLRGVGGAQRSRPPRGNLPLGLEVLTASPAARYPVRSHPPDAGRQPLRFPSCSLNAANNRQSQISPPEHLTKYHI